LELNETNQLLGYADINLFGDSKNTRKENTETLLEAIGDVGLEICREGKVYDNVSSSKLGSEPEYKDR
jgi:hypothetical protein